MTLEKIKDKIVFFFYPCQKQLNALTAEYNQSLEQLGQQVHNAKSIIGGRKVASQQQKH